jgi:hypothetical protein
MRYVAAVIFALLIATHASAMGDYSPVRWHDGPPPSIPEPGAVGLFATGGAIVGWVLYRRRK